MKLQRIVWNQLSDAEQEQVLQRPADDTSLATRQTVAQLIAAVQKDGDAAVRAQTFELDGVRLDSFAVAQEEENAATAAMPTVLADAVDGAIDRIERYHRAGMQASYRIETAPGVVCERLWRPITTVGLYIPAGTAPLLSSVIMLAVPARLAGCPNVILCTPPQSDGRADPLVLATANRVGIRRVFKIGGAQAVAAMAYGTETVPACDKLFGPGNRFVTAAKQHVAQLGKVAIDLPAGPSEVFVIADHGARPAFVAADLLSQAEHGPDSHVIVAADSLAILNAVEEALIAQLATLPRRSIAQRALAFARLIQVDSIATACAISNRYAPEHLILAVREPRRWLDRIHRAGSVFLGDYTPEALGDYCSGTNHVLPTHGAARAYSGLSVASFQTQISVQQATPKGLEAIGSCAMALAHAEQLDGHAFAVAIRLENSDAA